MWTRCSMMVELRSMPAAAAGQNTLRAQALEVGRLVAQLGQDGFAVLAPLRRAGRHLGRRARHTSPAG